MASNIHRVVFGLILLAAAGCRKASEPPPPPPVAQADNAITQNIERGKVTMDKAQISVDQINARLQAQDAQSLNSDQ